MKTPRIVTALFCVVAIVALYGCGGSSQLSESPTALDEFMENAQVHISASGLDGAVVSSDASKAFFDSDDFLGTGEFNGSELYDTVHMTCKFEAPVAVEIVPAGGLAAISIETDISSCADQRNCCIYTDVEPMAPCNITVTCLLDADLADLANTALKTEFTLFQDMSTNMNTGSGVIMTAVEKTLATDSVSTDLSAVTVDRSDCAYAYPTSLNFQVIDDAGVVWDGLNATANDGDESSVDHVWNVDPIGVVGTDPDDIMSMAYCEIGYANMFGIVSLADIVNDGELVDDLEITGRGRICNSQSYTDCQGDLMWEFAGEPY
jgi:hypothetical protein